MKMSTPVRFLVRLSIRAAAAALAVLAATAAQAAVTCHLEWATLRDGVKLATEVYLPDGPGPFPVILQRTPYNRFAPGPGSSCASAQFIYLASNGYAALNQDVRGRYRSEGTMDAMQQEAKDGYDAVEWAARQSWSNGRVGMFGGSYVGLTQWQPAIHAPPHLLAIAPQITASDYHDHWTYVNGAFDLWFGQSWMLLTFAGEQYMRDLEAAGLAPADVSAQAAAWVAAGRAAILTDWIWRLPLDSFTEFRTLAPYYYDWLAHPNYDAFWAKMDVEPRYQRVEVPALNIGGWYDIFQIGTVRNFQGMQQDGGTRAARRGSKLLMRPSCHACPANTFAGAVDFGPDNQVDLNALYVRWFDRWLKGIRNGIDEEPAARIFVMVPPDSGTAGSGFWIDTETFPPPGTHDVAYRLASGGHANTSGGDGVLLRGHRGEADGDGAGSADAPADRFTYDPRDPVPTRGGNMCCINDLMPSGAFDQSEVERRGDVLVYTSAPLKRDLTVIGSVSVKLWATSSAPDTDFTAKLVDVHPGDGFAQNILDRIVRARFRWGSKLPPSYIRPGEPYRYHIELGNTATVFKAGHRIRLEVSSSNFPHYVRNQNTRSPVGSDADMEVAHQTVLHDARHESVLLLPAVQSIRAP
jgi:putative CocE/NonD family hydrolase